MSIAQSSIGQEQSGIPALDVGISWRGWKIGGNDSLASSGGDK